MVQVELGSELEERLHSLAQARGVSVDEIVRSSIENELPGIVESAETRQARHIAAVDALMTFRQRHSLTLGPGLSFKDLIAEGRHS